VRFAATTLLSSSLLGMSGAGGCGGNHCESFMIVEPIISVIDATTRQPLCDATIQVVGHVTSECFGQMPDGGCEYACSLSSGSSQSLQVSAPGYQTTTITGVRAQTFGCDEKGSPPAPQAVTIALPPDGAS
jgi:hypothetical protein